MHVVKFIDSEGLWKLQNLQFCVHVFFADVEFQEFHKEHKLHVLFYTRTEVNLRTNFQKGDSIFQSLDFKVLLSLSYEPITYQALFELANFLLSWYERGHNL